MFLPSPITIFHFYLLTPNIPPQTFFPWASMMLSSFSPKLSTAPPVSYMTSFSFLPSHCWLLSFPLSQLYPFSLTAVISSMSKASIRISPESLSHLATLLNSVVKLFVHLGGKRKPTCPNVDNHSWKPMHALLSFFF